MVLYVGRLIAIATTLVVAGCASFPNSGPRMDPLLSGTQNPQMPLNVVMLTPANIVQFSKPRLADLPAPERVPNAALEYKIQPGDVIRVTIFEAIDGTFHAPINGGSVFDQIRVDSDGDITVPFVHAAGGNGNRPIKAAGLTRRGLRDAIMRSLEGKANQPQVLVDLIVANDLVAVSGDVKTPGSFLLLDGPQTVLDAVNKAGGPNQPPLQTDVIIRRKKSVARVSMVDLMLQGRDTRVSPGDDIIVENNPRSFYGMGAFRQSSSGTGNIYPFPRLHPSLQEALALMGGLTDNQADPTGIFVFRGNAPGPSIPELPAPTVLVLNYTQPTAIFLAQAFVVEPGDTIYVTNAPVYQFAKVIQILSGAGNLATGGKTLTGN